LRRSHAQIRHGRRTSVATLLQLQIIRNNK
jgi:hypothetical protein